ncbi:MAG: hypothetical protein EPO51_02725 [Phenylobacterium sp.]|uniref:hypothetical protein n=1 Tax=Phenylobacterium sp. TaxID=1871053 RepID=UPI0011F70B37|nr:hypothetical protein [Phenylobacterium sp.]TAJ74101.1 MAG: hypothetical protein EPO51_02725 [Phenylobacterium sp.]
MIRIITHTTLFAVAGLVLALPSAPARAQSAEQYNRAAQAIQICSSGMGAMVPECAKLRGGLGMSVVSPQEAASAMGQLGLRGSGNSAIPGIGGLGGLGGSGKAAGIASLLGSAISAARSQQAAAAAPAANPGAIQQAIGMCVQNAAGNAMAIQACLQIANAGAPPQHALGQQILPSAQRAQDSAMATHAAGQSYQACVAANPGNWQACLQTMNNNTQAGLLNAGVSPAQLQAAGGYVPPGYAPPASNPFGSLLPRR